MSISISNIFEDDTIVDEKWGIITHSKALDLDMYQRYYQDGYNTLRPDLFPGQYVQWQWRVMAGQRYLRVRMHRLWQELYRAKLQYSTPFLMKHREVFLPELLTFTSPVVPSGVHESYVGWKNRSEFSRWVEKLLIKFDEYGLFPNHNASEEEKKKEVDRVTNLYLSKIREQ